MGLIAVILAGAAIAVMSVLELWPDSEEVARTKHPLKYTEEVERWSAEYGLDPLLVYAVILTESGFKPAAESSAGARGLMQMTSDTFDWVKTKIAPEEDITFDHLFAPDTSIRFGTAFLSMCLERYGGDISTAAAAYHSGMGTVDELLQVAQYSEDGIRLHEFPHRNMSHYVNKINNNYDKYRELYG